MGVLRRESETVWKEGSGWMLKSDWQRKRKMIKVSGRESDQGKEGKDTVGKSSVDEEA